MNKNVKAAISAFTAAALLACGNVPAGADYAKLSDGLLYRYSDDGGNKGLMTGWVRRDGDRYYYKYGKMLKSKWLKVNGKRTYYLRKSGKAAVGTVKINGLYYTFDSKGRLTDTQYDTGGGNAAASGTALSAQEITTVGTAPTAQEIRELVEANKVNIASYIRLETKWADGDINISLVGFSRVQTNDNTVTVDSISLPVFTDGRIIGSVDIFRYEGELHYSLSAGGTGWDRMTEVFSAHPGEDIAFVNVGEFIALMIAPDGTAYNIGGGLATALDDVPDRYERYATKYNTFSFSKVIEDGSYVTVPAGVSNITLI